jgi:hypothetical protein
MSGAFLPPRTKRLRSLQAASQLAPWELRCPRADLVKVAKITMAQRDFGARSQGQKNQQIERRIS